jgi:hypothetical protein
MTSDFYRLRSGSTHKRYLLIVFVLSLISYLVACGGSSKPPAPPTPTIPTPTVALTRLSTDTFTNSSSQHATEVEPGSFAFGSTIVTAFQVGRIFGGGGSDIGFATSSDGGVNWHSGFLPGITTFQGGTFNAVSDPSVAFDSAHNVWLISTLPLGAFNEIAVSRSADGITWGNPIRISNTPDADKNWIVCDNTPSSAFFGHCYVEWDDPSTTGQGIIWMSTSTDGGLTWSTAVNTAAHDAGIGGVPVVQPNGTVIVPIEGLAGSMLVFTSSNGGTSWSAAVTISNIFDHQVAGGMRTDPLPSAGVDGSGTVYVVWHDCRFRTNCTSNDMVLSTTNDGVTWSSPTRIPIDAVTSTADHFISGLGVDPATSGSSAHLGLVYYFYPVANCTTATCQLGAGFISSTDGGNTWATPVTLAGPMSLGWLPNTFSGLMVGDYMSTVFSGGKAYPIFTVANAKTGSVFDQAVFTTTNAFSAALQQKIAATKATASGLKDMPLPGAHSDHPARRFYDLDHEHPIPQKRRVRNRR